MNSSNTIKFNGTPFNLSGRSIETEIFAPYFKVVSHENMQEINIDFFKDKIKVITTFPSLDTAVCDLQIKEFNKELTNITDDAAVLGISKDLPFAQKRYAEENKIDRVMLLSDYKFSSFGANYGIFISGLNLLARTAIIIDKQDIIRYIQVAEEITNELNYAKIIEALKEVISTPVIQSKQKMPMKCRTNGKILPLSVDMINELLIKESKWKLVDGEKIEKNFEFKNFVEAKNFIDIISILAEEEGHHPDMYLSYKNVKISLTTHSKHGLTENDFIMARIIDKISV